MAGEPPDAPSAETRGALLATAILGVLAASALELTVSALGLVPDSTPASQLQDYLDRTLAFQEYAASSAAFLILGIPFVAAVGVLLRRSSSLGGALSIAIWLVGILVLAVSAVLWVSVLASIHAGASNAPSMADQTFQARVANGIVDPLTNIGWVAFGAGFFLTAWLARRSKFVPGWLGLVGMAGGRKPPNWTSPRICRNQLVRRVGLRGCRSARLVMRCCGSRFRDRIDRNRCRAVASDCPPGCKQPIGFLLERNRGRVDLVGSEGRSRRSRADLRITTKLTTG